MISCEAATIYAPHPLPAPVIKQRRPAASRTKNDLALGSTCYRRAAPQTQTCGRYLFANELWRIGDDTAIAGEVSTARNGGQRFYADSWPERSRNPLGKQDGELTGSNRVRCRVFEAYFAEPFHPCTVSPDVPPQSRYGPMARKRNCRPYLKQSILAIENVSEKLRK
jgi:hypothetical protein